MMSPIRAMRRITALRGTWHYHIHSRRFEAAVIGATIFLGMVMAALSLYLAARPPL